MDGTSSSSEFARIDRRGPRHVLVEMGGRFGPTWLASLARGLAERQTSIVRAEATRTRDGTWTANLEISGSASAPDPATVPFVDLARTPHSPERAQLAIERFRLDPVPDHGGTLRLSIVAPDSIGFLSLLLSRLAMLALFPVEVRIETRDGRAHDTLFLGGVGGVDPCEQAKTTLERLMASSKVSRRPPAHEGP